MRSPGSRLLFPALLLVALVVVLVSRSPYQVPRLREDGAVPRDSVGYRTFHSESMATVIQVVLPDAPASPALAESVFALFRGFDARMSEWKPTSPLSAVNAAAGKEPVPVPPDLFELISRGIEIGGLTRGAFDLTWAALWGLWDFKAADPTVPDSTEAARRAGRVDYRKVRLDRGAGTVFLPEIGMKIGLGGIAKGYALDRAATALRHLGATSFLLVAGGQVYAAGSRAGRPWRVGIRDPRGAPEDYFAMVEVKDASVSTSGDYESFFIAGGVRYHHILDPRTGMPSQGLRSATVVAADATLADALSTAVMVLGARDGLDVVRGLPGVDALVVDETGRVESTAGLAGRVETIHPPRP